MKGEKMDRKEVSMEYLIKLHSLGAMKLLLIYTSQLNDFLNS